MICPYNQLEDFKLSFSHNPNCPITPGCSTHGDFQLCFHSGVCFAALFDFIATATADSTLRPRMAQDKDKHNEQTDTEREKRLSTLDDLKDQDVRVESSSVIPIYTQDEERHVKRKIDFILLPLLCMCYVFSVGRLC